MKTRAPINNTLHFFWQAVLLAACLCIFTGTATARSALQARFADLPTTLESPAFTVNKTGFTTDAELATFVAGLDARDGGHLSWRVIGKSAGGRDVHLLILTADGKSAPHEIAAARKPVVWIIGMQHGNEPAAGEAALELARRLTRGELRSLLERITVVIAPRMNPDGAINLRREALRENVALDLNRDHLELASNENQALQRWMRNIPPHLVLDLHEFLVGGRWTERFGVLQAADVQVQPASHPEVAEPLRALAREVFDPALEAAFKRYNLKSSTYFTLSTGDRPVVQMGSNHPATARNKYALQGAVSYLIESRGIGLGRDFFQRRVATHVLTVSAMLRAAAQNAEALKRASAQARGGLVGGELMVDHNTRREPRDLTMLDAASLEERSIKVEFQNSLAITPLTRRPVPVGYVLAADQEEAAQRLAQHGVQVLRIQRALDANVERYIVRSLRQEPSEGGVNIERVATDTQLATLQFVPGSFYVPMAQAQARIAAVLLEPEGLGSLLSMRVLKNTAPLANGVELPMWRVMTPAEFAGPLLEP